MGQRQVKDEVLGGVGWEVRLRFDVEGVVCVAMVVGWELGLFRVKLGEGRETWWC